MKILLHVLPLKGERQSVIPATAWVRLILGLKGTKLRQPPLQVTRTIFMHRGAVSHVGLIPQSLTPQLLNAAEHDVDPLAPLVAAPPRWFLA